MSAIRKAAMRMKYHRRNLYAEVSPAAREEAEGKIAYCEAYGWKYFTIRVRRYFCVGI